LNRDARTIDALAAANRTALEGNSLPENQKQAENPARDQWTQLQSI